MKFVLHISPSPPLLQHLLHICVDTYIRVYVNVLYYLSYLGKKVDMKNVVNMNINHQYYDYTMIVSHCLTFHII